MEDLKYWAFIHKSHIYSVVQIPASMDSFGIFQSTFGFLKEDYGSQYTDCRLGKVILQKESLCCTKCIFFPIQLLDYEEG